MYIEVFFGHFLYRVRNLYQTNYLHIKLTSIYARQRLFFNFLQGNHNKLTGRLIFMIEALRL